MNYVIDFLKRTENRWIKFYPIVDAKHVASIFSRVEADLRAYYLVVFFVNDDLDAISCILYVSGCATWSVEDVLKIERIKNSYIWFDFAVLIELENKLKGVWILGHGCK